MRCECDYCPGCQCDACFFALGHADHFGPPPEPVPPELAAEVRAAWNEAVERVDLVGKIRRLEAASDLR